MDIGPLRLMDNYAVVHISSEALEILRYVVRDPGIEYYWNGLHHSMYQLVFLGIVEYEDHKMWLTPLGHCCNIINSESDPAIWIPIE